MTKNWPSFTPQELLDVQLSKKSPWHDGYYVMYSSLWGGFSADPAVWGIPPDDHMVHRGDAVFESFKCIGGRAYCFKEHLERLAFSAQALDLKMPPDFEHVLDILKQARRLSGHDDFTVRLTVSRGPGSFSVNPYDSVGGSQLYLIVSKFKRPAPEVYERGVSLGTAPFPAKSQYAVLKTCDYLHNVLAKKAAVDAGANYVVSFDGEGFMTEGATENVAVITKSGDLCVPSFHRILKGVTLLRVMDKARELVSEGVLKSVSNRDLTKEEILKDASEMILTTTSLDVMGVSSWDGKPVGDGKAGPVAKELFKRIELELSQDGPHMTSLD
ncbi:MAG: aminotransferase class IV [Deltaproteobacteria bacterium]|jgi:branched-chain amino acid aminotransferase|nr:aminotransferase class IV [Deltaproteobacteria bacterium]